MKRNLRLTIIMLTLTLLPRETLAEGIGMLTGSPTGTYFRFGQEIAEQAKTVGLDILVKESQGSIDNIKRLNSKENAAFAIVQSDVLGVLKQNPQMQDVAARLRLIFPFYKEEVHLFANRAIQRIEDLRGKRIVFGLEGSGNWVTTVNLLHLMRIEAGEKLYLPPPEAVKAVLQGDADAMLYVAGKPVQVFLNLNDVQAEYPELMERVHFVPLMAPPLLAEYAVSELTAGDYAWLNAPVATIAVRAVLVGFDFSSKRNEYYQMRCQQLAQLGQALRDHLSDLQQHGHPKWQEVNLDEDVGIWQLDQCSRQYVAPKKGAETDADLDKLLKKRW